MPRPFQYRDVILSLLKENPIHPTVDWIHTRLREAHPRVSLATVYRTLRILVAEGLLCELPFGASEARFGLVREEKHYHFVCDVCHGVYDLPLPHDPRLEAEVFRATGHEVSRHSVEFYGRCATCAGRTDSPKRGRAGAPNPVRRRVPRRTEKAT